MPVGHLLLDASPRAGDHDPGATPHLAHRREEVSRKTNSIRVKRDGFAGHWFVMFNMIMTMDHPEQLMNGQLLTDLHLRGIGFGELQHRRWR